MIKIFGDLILKRGCVLPCLLSLLWLASATVAAAHLSLAPAQEDAYSRGREILRKAVEAAGGVETFRNIKNFTIVTQNKIKGRQTTMLLKVTETILAPDKTRQVMELEQGTRVQVLNGRDSWKQINRDVSPLSSLEKKEMQRGLFRDAIILFSRFDSTDLEIKHFADETLGGVKYYVLQVKNQTGDFFKLYIDALTNLIYKKTYQGAAEAGLATLEEVYSDYKKVEGIQIPYHTIVRANGRQFIEAVVLEVRINSDLGGEFFYRK